MIKNKTITIEQINWLIDNCIVTITGECKHLCKECPISRECLYIQIGNDSELKGDK